jgi:uncharacterized protein YbjT (DUF2867 family)
VPTTVLRCSWFAQNFSEHFLAEPVRSGVVALPAGDVVEPFVDLEDVADVAVAALVGAGHAGRTYELTGPRLLGFGDAARQLGEAIGRPVTYVHVRPQEYTAAALGAGVPPEEVEPLIELFTGVLDGRNAHVAHGVQEALGRPARDFGDYARRTAAAGAWDLEAATAAPVAGPEQAGR